MAQGLWWLREHSTGVLIEPSGNSLLQSQGCAGGCRVATMPEEQGEKHKNPKDKPLPPKVSLQCPLLTNPKLHQLVKEKCLQGPAAVSQKQGKECIRSSQAID